MCCCTSETSATNKSENTIVDLNSLKHCYQDGLKRFFDIFNRFDMSSNHYFQLFVTGFFITYYWTSFLHFSFLHVFLHWDDFFARVRCFMHEPKARAKFFHDCKKIIWVQKKSAKNKKMQNTSSVCYFFPPYVEKIIKLFGTSAKKEIFLH
jgi:hypothetical protein